MNDRSGDTLKVVKNLTLGEAEDILSLLPDVDKAADTQVTSLVYFKSINTALDLESLALEFRVSLNI